MATFLRVTAAAVVVFSLACSRKAPAVSPVANVPAEAFAPLTETDIARFARALPAVVEYVDWHRGSAPGKELRPRDDLGKVLASGIEWVANVEGIDSVLAANGTDWPFFRTMLYRVSACAWAVGSEGKEQNEEMKRAVRSEPNKALASQLRLRMKQMKAVAAAVPAANIEVFKRHYQDVKNFFYIVEAE
jgi:hypothetical protein